MMLKLMKSNFPDGETLPEKLEACPVCQTSQWKVNDNVGKKIPHKILRYFPLKPRLQRLFMSEKTSKKMVWHKEK
ncbi:hypothetical protein CASFOL_004957 [Castilleja foliolosa]|uniref:Uncharacterized protein n=1 Tax=Castilleja foliolosa TaxID=1961234 RepID=A0ABD3EFP0_9LAMI